MAKKNTLMTYNLETLSESLEVIIDFVTGGILTCVQKCKFILKFCHKNKAENVKI